MGKTSISIHKKMIKPKHLLILYTILNGVDVAQTYVGVYVNGLQEHNPIVRAILTSPEPILTLIALKLLSIFIIINLIKNKPLKHQIIILTIINTLLLLAAILNATTLLT